MGYVKFPSQNFSTFADELFIGITFRIPQSEVAMGQGKIHMSTLAQIGQGNTIHPSTTGQQSAGLQDFWKFGFNMGDEVM